MTRHRFEPLEMPLSGVRLIEASAGTGKTFSLAGLYLRLIVEQRASVREILVITFTRAATKELRERIRRRLMEAARIAHKPGNGDSGRAEDRFAEALIEASDEGREAVARRLADAAHRMDEANIATIHGFSQRAVTENAFDSALPFDRGEQVDDATVHDEVVADYWRANALGADAVSGFVDWWPTPEALDKALSDFRSRPHARLAGPSTGEIEDFAGRVRASWAENGQAFADQLRGCWHDGALKKQPLKLHIEAAGGVDEALKLLGRRLDSPRAIPAPPAWTAHLADAETQFAKTQLERGQALLEQPLVRDLNRLQSLARLAALQHAHERIDTTTAARKRERRQFSYADMIAALHAAVVDPETGPRLADALHATWPWALVDEFQDTDPLQYEILRRVYTGRDSGGLILIGDPKQAIYGFRGGDVFAYLDAADDAGDDAYSLDTNFRSTQGLLDAVETLFRAPGDDAFLVDGIDYQRVSAGRPDERTLRLGGKPLAPLTVWHLAAERTTKGAAQAACRDACVTRIRQLLDPRHGGTVHRRDPETGDESERPLEARDIAVLVNTNPEAAGIQRTLSRIGIAAVCLHQQSVFASAEATDLLHVLKAAASPADEGLLRGALAGDLLGCRFSHLVAMADDEQRWQAEVDRFQRAHEDWRGTGVLAMLQPLIQGAAERLLTYEDGERRMSNYLQLAELLAGAESETFGMAGLLRWLRRAIQTAGEGEADNAEQLRLESDEALVRIATVHKTKGLEYPIVFLPFAPWLGAGGNPDRPPHPFHDDDRQARVDVIGEPEYRDRAIREARAEGLRVLYVALTRAEIACFFPWGAANGTPNGALASLLHRDEVAPDTWGSNKSPKPLTDEDTQERLQALAGREPEAIAAAPLPDFTGPAGRLQPAKAPTGEARTDLPKPRPPWSIHSFTRLVHAADPGPAGTGADDEAQVAAPEPETAPRALAHLPGGRAYGSAVHALLETTDPAAWPAPGTAMPHALQAEVASALRQHGIVLPPGRDRGRTIEGTAELVRNALHTPLPEIGPLAGVPDAQRLPEMEFMLRLRGRRLGEMLDLLNAHGYAQRLPRDRQASVLRGLMHGLIDLVVESGGRYYVLDYKTNRLGDDAGDYEPTALADAVHRHHYDLQYLIYVTALHRFLQERLDDYDPGRHLGGVLYLFLRGMAPKADERGIHFDRPGIDLVERLDALLDAAERAA